MPDVDLLRTPGQRIAAARRREQKSQEEVAAAAGLHVKTLSKWENDRQRPERGPLERVAKFLHVSDQWILTGKEAQVGDFLIDPLALRERPNSSAYNEVSFASAKASQKGRIWLEELLLELAEAGADDDFLGWARRLLLAPMNYALYVGGQKDEMDDDQKLRHMQGLAVGVREVLKDRLRKTKSK